MNKKMEFEVRSFETRGIRRTFYMGNRQIEVLRDVSCQFAVGELSTIQGASGSGKTTLLHILGGLEKPDAGEVWIDGVSLYQQARSTLCRFRNQHVAFVFQAYHLLPELTALENVFLPALIGRHLGQEKAKALLEKVGLADRMNHRPAELSGGEQQRVAIARALMNDPQLLMADEPTGNLDSRAGAAVLDLLLDLQSQRRLTALLVTHDSGIAACGKRRLRLSDGILLEGE